jgi:hypothetical protein
MPKLTQQMQAAANASDDQQEPQADPTIILDDPLAGYDQQPTEPGKKRRTRSGKKRGCDVRKHT